MNQYQKPDKVSIVYFTGTGGTKMIAGQFAQALRTRSVEVQVHELDIRHHYVYQDMDLLLVIYPVYAMNAPKPIYDFIDKLPDVSKTPSAVISVSGGGEITPNTASRLHTIKRLEAKGFRVVYEKMLVMPANALATTPEELSLRLLRIIPDKTEQVVNDLMSGVSRRTDPTLVNRGVSFLGEALKLPFGGLLFGRQIKVKDQCNGCNLCAKRCPMGNIKMIEGTPHFRKRCAVCLRCIYGCPKKALSPGIGRLFVLKDYNLNRLRSRLVEAPVPSSRKYGAAFSGLEKYLENDDD